MISSGLVVKIFGSHRVFDLPKSVFFHQEIKREKKSSGGSKEFFKMKFQPIREEGEN